jgi:hydrogenase expression/formation protein HypC
VSWGSGKVLSLPTDEEGLGRVDFGGVVRPVCLLCVPEAGVGEYVMVHAGFAISRLDEAAALQTLDALRELDALEADELLPPAEYPLSTEPAECVHRS